MRIASFLHWVDHKTPPFLNLILTAGFHTLVTFALGYIGLSGEAAFGYTFFKEGEKPIRAILTGKPILSVYDPNEKQRQNGWTRAWVIADSVADAAGPYLAHLAHLLFI